jgi:hypothetical protein
VLSTKVGRRLGLCKPEERAGIGKFFDTPTRREIFDYSYDGIMRSVEDSLERLGIDRIDILYGHDLDVYTHGSQEAADLGGQYVRAARLVAQEVADAPLGKSEAVKGRGVEIADAGIPGRIHRRLRLFFRIGAIKIADRGGAEAEFGESDIVARRRPKRFVLHVDSRFLPRARSTRRVETGYIFSERLSTSLSKGYLLAARETPRFVENTRPTGRPS